MGSRGAADPNPWGIRLYLIDLADHLNLPEGAFVNAGIILFGAYGSMLVGYFLMRRAPVPPLISAELPRSWLLIIGFGLGIAATVAMAVYASQFTGLRNLVDNGIHVRTGNITVKWGYLQVLAQVGLTAFLILISGALRLPGWRKYLVITFAAAVWFVALVRILHVGGRLELGAFIFIPVLALGFLAKSKGHAIFAFAVVGAAALIVLNTSHSFSHDPLGEIITILSNMQRALNDHIVFALADFGFPHIVSAHTLTVVPEIIGFRYFIDLPLGLAYMLPNFSGVETLPPMILSLQVKLLPWIPVDLFSFGYYSLGTLGVLITFAAFGALLALFDGWLTESSGWLGQTLRAAWLFYLPFRLLYADPYAALQSGFGLIAGTVLIAVLALWAAWRRRGA